MADRVEQDARGEVMDEYDEYTEACVLANKILDRVNADPDDDLAMLARQLLRADEKIQAYEDTLDNLSRIGNAPLLGNSTGNRIAQAALTRWKRSSEPITI